MHARVLDVIQAVDGIKRGAADIGARSSRLLRLVCHATRTGASDFHMAVPAAYDLPATTSEVGVSNLQDVDSEFNNFLQAQLVPQDVDFWSTWFQT
jgi:hypothetical protein